MGSIFELIKFSHTIFALPFALAAMLVAAGGLPTLRTFLLIVAAMVTARNFAMAFNRFADADLDAQNPRTAGRPIPRGALSKQFTLGFALVNGLVLVGVAAGINRFCLTASPLILALLAAYSYTKRFTHVSHLVLGLALGLSPVAAWVAVTGGVAWSPLYLGAGVLLWVAGFDIIYATQDFEFDQKAGLRSLVVRLGVTRALRLSQIFHLAALGFLFLFGRAAGLEWPYFLTLAVIAILFFYEHSLVSPRDLSKVNAAFFNVNGMISLIYLSGVTLSLPNL